MPYRVSLTHHAALDLEDIISFIRRHDGVAHARHVLERIEKAIRKLGEFPERGVHPRELLDLGIREYREIFFRPYRIIYCTERKQVTIVLIADGRRDMQSLLELRLLGTV